MTTKTSTVAPIPGAEKAAKDFLNDDDSVQDIGTEEEEIAPVKKVKTVAPVTEKELAKDNRPTVAVLRARRFGQSFRVPASLGLSSQMLPPLTKKIFAIYELVDFFDTEGKKKIDPRVVEGPREVDPPGYELVSNYEIYDRYEEDLAKGTKLLNFEKGVIQKKDVTKESKMLIEINAKIPLFREGQMRLEIQREYPQFVWMELHPRNQHNKFRDMQKSPIFKRIDLDFKSAHSLILRMDLQESAYKYVRKLKHNELVALASAMTNPTISVHMPDNDIMQALLLRARTNAEEVLYKSPDRHNAACLDILNALDWGILDFDSSNNTYVFTNLPADPIFVVPLEEKPVDALASFFIGSIEGAEEDGIKAYEIMLDLVSYWAR